MCCWLATSSSQKHFVNRFWLPTTAAFDPYALTHPIGSAPQFRGLWLRVRSCSCPQVKCKRSVVFFLFVSFFVPGTPNFDQFQSHCSTSKSTCKPLLRNDGQPIQAKSQAAVVETRRWYTRSLAKARTNRRSKRNVSKYPQDLLFQESSRD